MIFTSSTEYAIRGLAELACRGSNKPVLLNDLVAGKHAATMLIAPFDVLAKSQGANVLGDASAAMGEYQGLVAGVRETWARNNRAAMVGYIRAWRDALDWMYDPKNKEEAMALFERNVS